MRLKLNKCTITIHTSYYKDPYKIMYAITPFIYIDYYSSIQRYTIGLSWLNHDVSIYMYITK